MEWWEWMLIVALAFIGAFYAIYRSFGAEAFASLMERALGGDRLKRLGERFGSLVSRFGISRGEQAARPIKMPERPADPPPAADSRQAARDSLRRFFGRTR